MWSPDYQRIRQSPLGWLRSNSSSNDRRWNKNQKRSFTLVRSESSNIVLFACPLEERSEFHWKYDDALKQWLEHNEQRMTTGQSHLEHFFTMNLFPLSNGNSVNRHGSRLYSAWIARTSSTMRRISHLRVRMTPFLVREMIERDLCSSYTLSRRTGDVTEWMMCSRSTRTPTRKAFRHFRRYQKRMPFFVSSLLFPPDRSKCSSLFSKSSPRPLRIRRRIDPTSLFYSSTGDVQMWPVKEKNGGRMGAMVDMISFCCVYQRIEVEFLSIYILMSSVCLLPVQRSKVKGQIEKRMEIGFSKSGLSRVIPCEEFESEHHSPRNPIGGLTTNENRLCRKTVFQSHFYLQISNLGSTHLKILLAS
jgi:hypothetical protein